MKSRDSNRPRADETEPARVDPDRRLPATPQELEFLVIRCQLGEPEALAELVSRWHGPLWSYVRRLTDDAEVAEEILQEGWLRIFRAIDRIRRPESLNAWLFSILRRTFMDRLRLRYADKASEPLDEEVADEAVPDLSWEDAKHLRASLDDLAIHDRETVVLFYLRELSLKEVAEIQGIAIGTVKSRLNRVRRLLREELRAKGVTR